MKNNGWLSIVMVLLLSNTPFAHATESGLLAALRSTIKWHPAMRGKQAEVNAKGYAIDSAKAQRYPSFSAQVGQRDEEQVAIVSLRQPLWSFGRIDNGIAYATADKQVGDADFLRVKRKLLEDTATAYAAILGIHRRLLIALDNVEKHKQLYQQIKRRHQGKLASKTDVLLVEVRLRQARTQVLRTRGELHVAKNELQALTQTDIDATAEVSSEFTQLPSSERLATMAIQNEASIKHKKQLITLASSNVDRIFSSAMPTLYLQAEQNLNAPGYASGTHYSVMLDGTLDGFGFSTFGRSRAAKAKLDAAKQDLYATRNDIRRKIKTLLDNRQMQQTLIRGLQQAVDDLQTTMDSYSRQYGAGFKAWLEVLNLQRELTDQRIQQTQAYNEWLINTLKIRILTGMLDPLLKEKGRNNG
ncbi:MAG: TolC family protein [Gammaproteobacteria bacterium]|nr:TolC family protein [Gammaproteobacteria bacterium]